MWQLNVWKQRELAFGDVKQFRNCPVGIEHCRQPCHSITKHEITASYTALLSLNCQWAYQASCKHLSKQPWVEWKALEIICYPICLKHYNSLLSAIVLLFVGLSLPLIPCCHGPGKGWIMDHALMTLIVINLSGVMTHVSDSVKLWSALSPLCLLVSSSDSFQHIIHCKNSSH